MGNIITLRKTNNDSVRVVHSLGASKRGGTEAFYGTMVKDVKQKVGACLDFAFNAHACDVAEDDTDSKFKPDVYLVNALTNFRQYIELDTNIHFIWGEKVAKAQASFDRKRALAYKGTIPLRRIICSNNGAKEAARANVFATEVVKNSSNTEVTIVNADVNKIVNINTSISKEAALLQSRRFVEGIVPSLKEWSGADDILVADEYIEQVLSLIALRKNAWLLNAAEHYMNGDPVTVKNKGILDIIIDSQFTHVEKPQEYLKLAASRSNKALRRLVH